MKDSEYNPQITKDRIMSLCKRKKIHKKDMLAACSLNINAINNIGKMGMASFSLAKIADYLDCSVDYLLGRTDDDSLFATTHKTNN